MKRPFGQNFLFDKNILQKIIDCSSVTKQDTVVEIGPGLGTLTKFLADNAKKVIAIEFDRKLIARLQENLADTPNVEVIRFDALKFPFDVIPETFKVVSNIPYYITSPLLFRLLDYRKKVSSMTLLLQKEVAERIVAIPGTKQYGTLSISAQLYSVPVVKFTISKKAFTPPPAVDSAVVYFSVYPESRYAINNPALFRHIVKKAFSQRRKTVLNSLRSYKDIRNALAQSGIDTGLRAENLSIDDFVRLSNLLCSQ